MEISVESWWVFISVISVLNIMAWGGSVIYFYRYMKIKNPDIYFWRKVMLWCSGIYVFGCAFRSFLPRIDLERICLVENTLSSMFIGRTAATVAEVSFIVICAALLREAGKGVGDRFALTVSILLVPLILVAEGFSWYAVLTTNYFGSVIEESLWAVAGLLMLMSFVWLWPHVKDRHKKFLTVMIMFTIGFIVFMITVDVPMYIERWKADTAAGIQYLSVMQGVSDSMMLCKADFSQDVWREEIPWMTLYFTTAVWVSIALPLAPNYKKIIKKSSRRRLT